MVGAGEGAETAQEKESMMTVGTVLFIIVLGIVALVVGLGVAIKVIDKVRGFQANRPAREWRKRAMRGLRLDWTHDDCYRWLVRNGFDTHPAVSQVGHANGDRYSATCGQKSLTDRPIGSGDRCVVLVLEFRHELDGRIRRVRAFVASVANSEADSPRNDTA